jgi:hypothetical protein
MKIFDEKIEKQHVWENQHIAIYNENKLLARFLPGKEMDFNHIVAYRVKNKLSIIMELI